MLKKIISVENVGKFHSLSPKGHVEFSRLNLIYAPNGAGKTTLCDIFRSLQSGSPDRILGRRTLGATGEPMVMLRLDGDNATFKNHAWSKTIPEIVVFDATYVHENVYAGDVIEHAHRKNLYRVIVGRGGVQLAAAIELFDRQMRELNYQIRECEKEIRTVAGLSSSESVEGFLKHQTPADIDKDLGVAEQRLAAQREADELSKKATPVVITLPSVPNSLEEVLGKSIESVSADAEQRIKKHIAAHLREPDQAWLQQGLQLAIGETCPFCSQSLASSELIEAYRTYFSDAYGRLQQEIASLQAEVRRLGSPETSLRLEKTLTSNEALFAYWQKFITVDQLALDPSPVVLALQALSTTAGNYLDRKAASPLEVIATGADWNTARKGFNDASAAVREYNEVVRTFLERVAERKRQMGTSGLYEAEIAVLNLGRSKLRARVDVARKCEEHKVLATQKTMLEKQKDSAKAQLDVFDREVFDKYERALNRLLGHFGAGFRVVEVKPSYVGGTPNSSFALSTQSVPVDVGDADTPEHKPSFRNTLSAGDRSALALAFFLVQLQSDPELERAIVVLDDPFTSQDRSRRQHTQSEIRRLAEKVAQVLVLSHDPTFLEGMLEARPQVEVRTLKLIKLGDGSTLTEWDCPGENRPQFQKDRQVLLDYSASREGDPQLVARKIRPHLEDYLRHCVPGSFNANEWLGDMIKGIRDSATDDQRAVLKQYIEELDDLNTYSKGFHHGSDGKPTQSDIDPDELASYVERALTLMGGF